MFIDKKDINALTHAFAVVDASVDRKIAQKEVACGPGCGHCCWQPIPATPMESFGIMHAISGKNEILELCLKESAKFASLPVLKRPCPFLQNNLCQIYDCRPIACRRFIVCGKPCAEGEDPTLTRPRAMLVPDRKALELALSLLYPWHERNWKSLGLPSPPKAVGSRERADWILRITSTLQAISWNKIFHTALQS